MDDRELLMRYAVEKDQEAFGRLVRQEDAKASVLVEWLGTPNGMRMEFVGADGKVHDWNSMIGSSGSSSEASESGLPQRTVFGFNDVPGGLKTLRIKWRPIESVQFKDVRLNPK